MAKKIALDALDDANSWFDVAIMSGKTGKYNIGLYSLEMALEIVMKAVLINLDVNYPKVHDIMPTFLNAVSENKGKLPKEFIDKEDLIMKTFRELLKRRGPAGYTFSSDIKISDLEGDFKKYGKITKELIDLCIKAVKFK